MGVRGGRIPYPAQKSKGNRGQLDRKSVASGGDVRGGGVEVVGNIGCVFYLNILGNNKYKILLCIKIFMRIQFYMFVCILFKEVSY